MVCVEANGTPAILIRQLYAYVKRAKVVLLASSLHKVKGRTNAVQANPFAP